MVSSLKFHSADWLMLLRCCYFIMESMKENKHSSSFPLFISFIFCQHCCCYTVVKSCVWLNDSIIRDIALQGRMRNNSLKNKRSVHMLLFLVEKITSVLNIVSKQ